jgi:hypothetical protein
MRKSASVGALQNTDVSTLVREVATLERRLRGIVRGVTAEQAAAFGSEQACVYRECCRVYRIADPSVVATTTTSTSESRKFGLEPQLA